MMRILIRSFAPASSLVLSLFVIFFSGCTGGQATRSRVVATGGSVQNGRHVIVQYHCGRCHTIPGIRGANGVFGPPLNAFARRTYIAGEFPNSPQYVVRWVQAPASLKPATAMPDLGLSQRQARDVAAYLETLE